MEFGMSMSDSQIIDIPDSLPYPPLLPLETVSEFRNKFCYILKSYSLNGIALMVVRSTGNVCIRFSDFAGNILTLQDPKYGKVIAKVMEEHSGRIVTTMQLIKIPQAIFYFSINHDVNRLVDVRLSMNKFCSPGYLNDFFGRQGIPQQERVGEPVVLDESVMERLSKRVIPYEGDSFIIKPSAFKSIVWKDEIVPLYGVIH
jgi:hypothetical protein